MKEATGELNVTLIVVTIVALLSVLFFTVIWPRIHGNFNRTTKCDKAVCNCDDPTGETCSNVVDGMIKCKYYDSVSDTTGYDIWCVWKG